MTPYRQAVWPEPVIYEYSRRGSRGFNVPPPEKEILDSVGDPGDLIPKAMRRRKPPGLPEVSEVDVVRHYTRLSQMNWGVDLGTYPLGSCTMKYNPKYNEFNPLIYKLEGVHPMQPDSTVQGILEILYRLEKWLAELTGMDRGSFQPAAGAHGELTGVLMIRKYHLDRGEGRRNEMIVPDSAHGTNPASASMGGFRVLTVPSNSEGTVDIEALKAAVSDRTAGMMLTNPNTLGIFEKEIGEIAEILHEAGGLLYYDGANLNGIMGITRPGDMGFDIVHLNLHKTFSAPHGGGGPGACAVLARGELVDYLPAPLVDFDGEKYYWNYEVPRTIGRVRAYYGNIAQVVRAYLYVLSLGGEGLLDVAKISVLNTNYFIALMRGTRGLSIPFSENIPRKHEVVISAKRLEEETGVTALDLAKALLDRGVHAPTIYFPLIVDEALMIEFTETASMEEIRHYARILGDIVREAYENPDAIRKSPTNTGVGRLDEVKANLPRTYAPTYKHLRRKLLKGNPQLR